MQDALLKLDVIAGSKKDVQMSIAHWKAAAPLAQLLTSQRQVTRHFLSEHADPHLSCMMQAGEN